MPARGELREACTSTYESAQGDGKGDKQGSETRVSACRELVVLRKEFIGEKGARAKLWRRNWTREGVLQHIWGMWGIKTCGVR